MGVVRLKGFGGSGNRWGWWGLADNDPWPVVRCPAPRLPVFPSSRLPVFPSSRPQRGREICRRGENFPPSGADFRKVPPSLLFSFMVLASSVSFFCAALFPCHEEFRGSGCCQETAELSSGERPTVSGPDVWPPVNGELTPVLPLASLRPGGANRPSRPLPAARSCRRPATMASIDILKFRPERRGRRSDCPHELCSSKLISPGR